MEPEVEQAGRFDLGRGYWPHLPRGPRSQGDLYHHGSLSKRVNLADKAERRLLVVELQEVLRVDLLPSEAMPAGDDRINPGAPEESAAVPAPAPVIELPYTQTHG